MNGESYNIRSPIGLFSHIIIPSFILIAALSELQCVHLSRC